MSQEIPMETNVEQDSTPESIGKKKKKENNDHKVNTFGSGAFRATGPTTKVYEEILSDPRIRFIYMADNLIRALALGYFNVEQQAILKDFLKELSDAKDYEKIKRLEVKFKNHEEFLKMRALIALSASRREHPTNPFNTCNLMANKKAWPIYKKIALEGVFSFFIKAHNQLLLTVNNDNRQYTDSFGTNYTKQIEKVNIGMVGTFSDIRRTISKIKGPVTVVDEINMDKIRMLRGLNSEITAIFGPRDLFCLNFPIRITVFTSRTDMSTLGVDNKINMYRDYSCNIGGTYYVTRKGQDQDAATTSFLSDHLKIDYLPNAPRVEIDISDGIAKIQHNNQTLIGKVEDGDIDMKFSCYMGKKVIRLKRLTRFGKPVDIDCYNNFKNGISNFLIRNFDVTTPTSKAPGYTERHKGYVIYNVATKKEYYSTYYLHYRVTQHYALYEHCKNINIHWKFSVPDENLLHGDLCDYIFDNRYSPPLLLHCHTIATLKDRRDRAKLNPYRAANRDFIPSHFDDTINTFRNAFMLDDIIKEGKLIDVAGASLKYGTDKNFPYRKEKDPLLYYLNDYYSTISYDVNSSIDSVLLSDSVVIVGNRDFKDDDAFINNQASNGMKIPEDKYSGRCEDEHLIYTKRMYDVLMEYNRKMMEQKKIDAIDTI